jgi:hypothetical protein
MVRSMLQIRWIPVALALLALTLASPPARCGQPLVMEAGFAPKSDLTLWRLDLMQGYPMVRGRIGEVNGFFLVDTGTPWGLLLNSAHIELQDAEFVLAATAGSGQRFDVFRVARLPTLTVQEEHWPDITRVNAGDLSFFERGTGITPLLGFVGAHFFEGSEITIDYPRRRVAIRTIDPESGLPRAAHPADDAPGELWAETRFRGEAANAPLFDAELAGSPVQVMLDTGNPGASLPAARLQSHIDAGDAQAFSKLDETASYRIEFLKLGDHRFVVDDVIGHGPAHSPADAPEPAPLLKIGHSLFKQTVVRWNYATRRLQFHAP